ncbi:DMT family transporter [Sphingomicrobium sp. XHP0239]|uniref:DMT family transporter n=1 Tax=Sphingomicrobium maritimum TaxID=3133972 RepID=UPI0031CC9F53
MSRAANPLSAFLVAVLGVGCLSAMDGAVKAMSLDVGALDALCWRLAASVPLVVLAYVLLRKTRPTRTAVRLHVMRGVLGVPMALLFFSGLERVPMAQAIALAFMAPLFALFWARLLLGEKVEGASVLGSIVAFSGTLLIFFGQAQADMGEAAFVGALMILGSAVLYSFNIILMRQQSQVADPIEIALFLYLIPASLFWIIGVGVGGGVQYPEGQEIAIVAAAVTGVAGTILLAWAYRRATASYLSASEYAGFLWAAAFGFLLFGEVPLPWTVAGGAAIIAGVWIASRPAAPGHEMIEA